MNFIDIASWQHGINLPTLFAQNPLDGVIVKATQGVTYVNPDYAAWTKWLSDNGKLFGLYHYLDGADAEEEAAHFYTTIKPYIGKGVPVADYEDPATSKGTYWLKKFLDKFYALSGVRCMVYCSLSVVQTQDFKAIASSGHALWVAQYADMVTVHGFINNPWQKGSVSPFPGYLMHQYTSCGRLVGYDGNLDFDKYYGTAEEWAAIANGQSAEPTPTPTPTPTPPTLKPATPTIVLSVLKNEYGIGQERIDRLRADGYDPTDVQNTINRLYNVSAKVKSDIGKDMSYINSILWIVRSL